MDRNKFPPPTFVTPRNLYHFNLLFATSTGELQITNYKCSPNFIFVVFVQNIILAHDELFQLDGNRHSPKRIAAQIFCH